jgi:hypothetical protein
MEGGQFSTGVDSDVAAGAKDDRPLVQEAGCDRTWRYQPGIPRALDVNLAL